MVTKPLFSSTSMSLERSILLALLQNIARS
ncbi:Protein of unknown function [Leuconostoc citreum LBAE C10]|nr:Protein of unknown function [Leuconostoc citreum LBAE C10]